MKARIDRREFAEALDWVTQAIGARNVHPALASVRMEFVDGSVRLTGTDYNVWHQHTLDADHSEPQTLLSSASLLRQLASSMSGDVVEMAADERLSVSAGTSRYRLALLPVEEYPEDRTPGKRMGSVGAAQLRDAVRKVAGLAMDDASGNASIAGVALHAENGALTLSATDRHRMGWTTLDWDGEDFLVRVPASALSSAVKVMSGDCRIDVSEGDVALSDLTHLASIRCFQKPEALPIGRMYRPVSECMATVDTAELATALKRLTSVSSDSRPVADFEAGPDGISLTCASDMQDGQEHVAATTDGEGTWRLNIAFTQSLLSVAGDSMVIGHDDKTGALVFDQPADPITHYLIQKVRVIR